MKGDQNGKTYMHLFLSIQVLIGQAGIKIWFLFAWENFFRY